MTAVTPARAEARPQVPDALAPPPRHPRFPLLDGMRAIAVLSVVMVHAALMGGAFSSSLGGRLLAHLNIGVTIFFLISGFLLYRPMIAYRGGGPPPPASSDYARRRFLRIYPAYWVALTVLALVPGVTVLVGGHWLPMYALVHTLPVYHGQRCQSLVFECGLAQTWSLVVEATFYVALPLYAATIGRLTRRLSLRAWALAQLLALALASAASLVLQFALLYPPPAWLAGSVVAYVFWFALGMGMAVASVVWTRDGRLAWIAARPEVLWALAIAGYAGLCAWLPPTPFLLARHQQLIANVALALIAALLLAPAVFGDSRRGVHARVLAHPVVAWIGLISYGIFLWHYAVALKLGSPGAGASFPLVLVGTLGISVVLAAASYYLVERPFLRLKYRPQARSQIATRSSASSTRSEPSQKSSGPISSASGSDARRSRRSRQS